MKTNKLLKTTISTLMCLSMIAPVTFASEIKEKDTIIKIKEIINTRAGAVVSGTVSRSAPFYYQGSTRNITCIFNITYDNLSGKLYSASISSMYSNYSGYTYSGKIMNTTIISNDTWRVDVRFDMYEKGRYVGSSNATFTI